MSSKNPRTLEQFYTKKEVSERVISLFAEKVFSFCKDLPNQVILEPSAGCGSFSDFLFDLFDNVEAIDIEPLEDRIKKINFFDYSFNPEKEYHIVGNPPFGKQSSLARKFIKNLSTREEVKSISFILPKSFKKVSLQKSFGLYFHLIFEEDLPKSSFFLEGQEFDVPCVFQIWKREKREREIVSEITSTDLFTFIKKNQITEENINRVISVRRVGVNAGEVTHGRRVLDKSIQSHYFLMFETEDTILIFLKFDVRSLFKEENTVGPKSISKPELIKIFEKRKNQTRIN